MRIRLIASLGYPPLDNSDKGLCALMLYQRVPGNRKNALDIGKAEAHPPRCGSLILNRKTRASKGPIENHHVCLCHHKTMPSRPQIEAVGKGC